jgi:hypothetical protein
MIIHKINNFFSDLENQQNISYFEKIYKRTNIEDYVNNIKKWKHNIVCDYNAINKTKFVSNLINMDLKFGEAIFIAYLPNAETFPQNDSHEHIIVLCNIISDKPWEYIFYNRKNKEIVKEKLNWGDAFIYNNKDYYCVRDKYDGKAYLELNIKYYSYNRHNIENNIFTGMAFDPLLNKIYSKLKED